MGGGEMRRRALSRDRMSAPGGGPASPTPGDLPDTAELPASPDAGVPGGLFRSPWVRGPAHAAAGLTRNLVRGIGIGLGRGVPAVGRKLAGARDAHGARESGLARLIDLTATSSAGDALIAVALAGSLFFAVPLDQARERVALYLLLTLVPFAVLSPVIGPVLDHLRGGRRYALAATFVLRGVLAVLLAQQLSREPDAQSALTLYPVAFGLLVSSKAYALLRAAVVPRLLPPTLPLVPANSRVAMAALAAATVAAAAGAGVSTFGAGWPAALAAMLFFAGVLLSAGLPRRVDSAEGELPLDEVAAPAAFTASPDWDDTQVLAPTPPRRDLEDTQPSLPPVPAGVTRESPAGVNQESPAGVTRELATLESPVPTRSRARRAFVRATRGRPMPSTRRVRTAIRANAGVRVFSGFLLFYFAFLLRETPLGGLSAIAGLSVILVGLGVGGAVGTGLASLLQQRAPDRVALVGLGTLAVVVLFGATAYGLPMLGVVAFVGGVAQSMGRLCLDALIQQDLPERLRARAFARTETIQQLAWVFGGAGGMYVPGPGSRGLLAGGAALSIAFVIAMVTAFGADRARSASSSVAG